MEDNRHAHESRVTPATHDEPVETTATPDEPRETTGTHNETREMPANARTGQSIHHARDEARPTTVDDRTEQAVQPGLDVDVVTIFPHMFPGPLGDSITGRALAGGLARINTVDIREFATDRHRSTDDYPYGGGPGMVMRPEPLVAAIESVRRPTSRLILLSPTGRRFTLAMAYELAAESHLVVVCGRYEGVDERVRLATGAQEVSIGDFVLTGGEIAAMVVLDAVMRLLPGVLRSTAAWRDESHSFEGLLEYPQYTRPVEFRGLRVPDVLLSGHHAQVAAWRRRQALERTRQRRPDLLTDEQVTELDSTKA